MKRILFILALIPILVTATPYKYDGSGYCQDFAGKLSRSEIISLNEKLKDISAKSSIEIAIVTIPSLDGRDIEGFANELFREWGIGKASSDNGVLVILSINDGKSRIEVGYGMEPYLTDAKSRRILEDLKPFLRNGDFYGAFSFAIDKIGTSIEQAKTESKGEKTSAYLENNQVVYSDPIDWPSIFLYILGFVLTGGLIYLIVILIKNTNEFTQEVAEKISDVTGYRDKVTSLATSVDMKDEAESVKDMSGYITRKLGKLRYNIFSNSEKEKTFDEADTYLNKMREVYTQADRERIKRDMIRREEEERKEKIRREEEARKKRIRDEADILKKAEILLSKNSAEQINSNFELDKKIFGEKFPGVGFIKKPEYEKAIFDLKQTMTLVKGDGMALNVVREKFDFLMTAITASSDYIESIKQKKSGLKSDLEKLNKNKRLITNQDVLSTKFRKDLSEEIKKISQQAEESYLNNKFDQCQSLLYEAFKKIDLLSKKISDEKYLRAYISEVEKEVISYSSGKYVSVNSTRRSWAENAKSLLDKAKSSLDPDKTEESMRVAKSAAESAAKIKKHYNDEIEEEERKKRREGEERRRRREEEEEENRRRRNSYSSYDSSWSSSSSDSGSSFGGGDSGGGGSSSDW
jgi:uncharacterized membrane protein YgcG